MNVTANTAANTAAPRRTPALGPVRGLSGRTVAVRLAILVGLLAAALAVRTSGVLHPDTARALPPLPEAANVVPGVVRSGAPTETDLVMLHDTAGVRGVVVVGTATIEEQAVAPALGLDLLQLDVASGAAPTAAQVDQLRQFVKAARGLVLLHDDTGTGPVVATAAALQLAVGLPLDTVLAGLGPTPSLDDAQRQALGNLARAVSGPPDPTNPYATLTR